MRVLPIVEGTGDMEAVPELIRRVAHANHSFELDICRPHRRGDLPKVRRRFADYLQVAALEGAPILWVMDYDCDDCSDVDRDIALLADDARKRVPNCRIEFAFMVQEFESLFIADEATTRRVFSDIPASIVFPEDAEAIRDAKGWLSEARPKGSAYKPTQHQQRLAAQVNLAVLREKSRSFRRFEASVKRLLGVP